MELIGKNKELVQYLTGHLTLLSSKLRRVEIYEDLGGIVMELYFELQYALERKNIKLKFSDVQEYSFYHSSDYIFYNVESCKFFTKEDYVYISLDPYDERDSSINNNDQDFIKAKFAEGYFI